MLFVLIVTFFLSNATEAPPCQDLFTTVDALLQSQPLNAEATKKELFKIVNDKRTEMTRFVKNQKENFQKEKNSELNAFDIESKKNKTATSDERERRRKERTNLSLKVQNEKKEFNKNLDNQDKTCQKYLKKTKEDYLAKLRDLQKNLNDSQREKKQAEAVLSPDLEEFKNIPKGPATVLKPQ